MKPVLILGSESLSYNPHLKTGFGAHCFPSQTFRNRLSQPLDEFSGCDLSYVQKISTQNTSFQCELTFLRTVPSEANTAAKCRDMWNAREGTAGRNMTVIDTKCLSLKV